MNKTRINVGCGQTPTAGWLNFDNSWSLRLSKIPYVAELLYRVGFLEESQYKFVLFARKQKIEYGDAVKGLPVSDEYCEVLYSSHMIEHLDRNEVVDFLDEAFRVLVPGGILRIAVPDIKKYVEQYNQMGDADTFIKSTHLCVNRARTFRQRFRLSWVGTRHHQWMYDGNSLVRLVEKNGFVNAEIMPAGSTKINNHQPLNLQERASNSVYVEAEKPNIHPGTLASENQA